MNIDRLNKKMEVFFKKKGLKRLFRTWMHKKKNREYGYKNSNIIKRMKRHNHHLKHSL